MREFIDNLGGRILHNDDLEAIQDHIAANQSIFTGEQPFILSGLNVTLSLNGTFKVSSGHLWIGGKIRYFSGVEGLSTTVDNFLNVEDSSYFTAHNDGLTRKSKVKYGVTISSIGSGGSNQILLSSTGNVVRYEDLYSDRLVEKNSSEKQVISTPLQFMGAVDFAAPLSLSKDLSLTTSLTVSGDMEGGELIYTGGNIVIAGDVVADKLISGSRFEVTGNPAVDVILPQGLMGIDSIASHSIALESVTSAKIGLSSVSEVKVAPLSILNEDFEDNVLVTSKFASNCVDSAHIVKFSIPAEKLSIPVMELIGMGTYFAEYVYPSPSASRFTVTHNLNLDNPEQYIYVYAVRNGGRSFTTDASSNYRANSFDITLSFKKDTVADANGYAAFVQFLIYKINA